MSVNLGFLEVDALTCPLPDVRGHVGPDETGGNESTCGVDTGMANGVDVMENLLLKLHGNEWSK